MYDSFQGRLIYLILALPAFVVAFTVHEFAHAYTAYRLGDDTAKRAGKLSLDPFKMMDPIGSLFLVVTILIGAPLIGWAFVPVNRNNFAHPRRDNILVSVAGPASNVVQAFIWLLLLFIIRMVAQAAGHQFSWNEIVSVVTGQPNLSSPWVSLACACGIGVMLNFSFAVFNMLPLPPFDGGFIAEELVPALKPAYDAIRPFSFIIIILLINSRGLLDPLFDPVVRLSVNLMLRAFGLPAGV